MKMLKRLISQALLRVKSSENMIDPFRKVQTCDLPNSLGGSYELVSMMK